MKFKMCGGIVLRKKNALALLAALTLCSLKAAAQSQTYVGISTAVWSNVTVSTYQPTRVDDWNLGTEGYALPSRTGLEIVTAKSSPDFWCNRSSAAAVLSSVLLSTQTASANLGEPFQSPSTNSNRFSVLLSTLMSYWCEAAASTPVVIHVSQVAPR